MNRKEFHGWLQAKKLHYGVDFSCLVLDSSTNPFCSSSYGLIHYKYKVIVFNWDLVAELPSVVQNYLINHEFAHYFAGNKAGHGPYFQEWLSILDYDGVEDTIDYWGKGELKRSRFSYFKEALYKAFIAPLVMEVIWRFQK